MEYILLHGSTPEELTQVVNQWIADGFKPIGGIAISQVETPVVNGRVMSRLFAQAMLKE